MDQSPVPNRGQWRLATLLLSLMIFLPACQPEPEHEEEPERDAFELPVREVEYRTPVLNRTYPGRTAGLRQVEVRAQVEGVLRSREYEEGDVVESGDTLFHIDPNRYSVEVKRAEADLERARAAERQASREWELVSSLYEEEGTTQRELDQARSDLEIARADVELAEAELEARLIDLDYSQVEAAIDGVAGLEERSVGNLIQEGDLLTTLTQMDPMQVHFAIPEAHMRAFGGQVRGPAIDVFVTLPDGQQYPMPGRLDFVGSTVDEATGTIAMRAVFPNPDQVIIPGQFVRITLGQLMLEQVISVPRTAVARDSSGPIVYVLNEDDEAEIRSVRLGTELDDEVAIDDGLSEGDRVILSGLATLEPGREVIPQPEEEQDETLPGEQEDDEPEEIDEGYEVEG